MVLMLILQYFIVICFGFIFGSFLTAYTYRIPKKISIIRGRSFCPTCKKQINWYDNIPLFSYLILRGRCRKCHQKISIRYPLIELFTALTFGFIFFAYNNATLFKGEVFNYWINHLGVITLPYFLLIAVLLIAIFVIDMEKQIIPDNLIFFLYFFVSMALVLTHIGNFYGFLLAGYISSLFLLLLVFITKGKGMGLGDVKLAIPLGTILGLRQTPVWIFLAFLTGAYIGIILILVKRAKLRQKVPFGPFLIFAFIISCFWGSRIINNLSLF
jgi:prepilin signal peptidase PulO-like enzyme (type II secretory pathway)